ncbi:NAD(P)/FAD-dependent oxidoreductase [Halioxenophilus aromaticivorans]|uniref:FAD-dependent oxidoreductase n=1 Tax=Halioxenophilus aromaticivorans TaxID=1306992 RepID=A0AAV3TYF0_9ALTE
MTAAPQGIVNKPKIAIIGTGIAGLTAAYRLQQRASLTVFEAANRIGGHTATVDVNHDGEALAIDTGFIVFNDWTYPRFKQLLSELNVEYQPSSMGFSVTCERTGLEYSGENFATLFAQKRRFFDVKYWRFLIDIVRFNKNALAALEKGELDDNQTLEQFLEQGKYSQQFATHYLVPMASAIWSKSSADSLQMPVRFFAAFFKNHGLLSVNDRPTWHVIKGGSRAYLEPITRGFKSNIRLNAQVTNVRRTEQGVSLQVDGVTQYFDQVIFACHSDQALACLGDASEQERSVLEAIEYQNNDVVLHWDAALLPHKKACWSSWNYRITQGGGDGCWQDKAVLTYDMNLLQGLVSDTTYCVTLNHTAAIDPDKILRTFQYAHPRFTREAVAAQQRWPEINGVNNTWFCGAWWANGFHEDGVVSGERVASALVKQLASAKAAVTK